MRRLSENDLLLSLVFCHSNRPPPAIGSSGGGQDDLATRERKNPAMGADIVKLPVSPGIQTWCAEH